MRHLFFLGACLLSGMAFGQFKQLSEQHAVPLNYDQARLDALAESLIVPSAKSSTTPTSQRQPWSTLELPSLLHRSGSAHELAAPAVSGPAPGRRSVAQSAIVNGLYSLEAAAVVDAVLPGFAKALRVNRQNLMITGETQGDDGVRHIQLQQRHLGLTVYGGQLVLHAHPDGRTHLTGSIVSVEFDASIEDHLSPTRALELAESDLGYQDNLAMEPGLAAKLVDHLSHDAPELMWLPRDNSVQLVYRAELSPTLAEHLVLFIDAYTGEVLDQYSKVCTLLDEFTQQRLSGGPTTKSTLPSIKVSELTRGTSGCGGTGWSFRAPFYQQSLPGPRTASAIDLLGQVRTLQTYEGNQGAFYLIDATRPMYTGATNVPGDEEGALVVANARNSYPDQSFRPVYASSSNNDWSDRAEVSAHYNGEQSYEYFRTVHGRNSLNGAGGSITAFVNVVDENGAQMDNAFYSNGLLFYGNGDRAFTSLAASLDVAGHEMSHGVINFSSDLEYRNESGALNEHFADVFGVMIDRDDWTLGEDIVRPSEFPSGALRSFIDPTQGGNSLGDAGYQPGHYNDRYTGAQDNGGVHINSGIPNRACYLMAQTLGRAATESLYYDVLTNYLTRTSQFVDYRNALQAASAMRWGQGSSEWNAVVAALDAVGIPGSASGGGGTGQPNDQQTNPGTQLVAHADAAEQLVQLIDLAGNVIITDITPSAIPASRVSISDDGSQAFLVTDQGDINQIFINYANNTVSDNIISGDLDNDGVGDIRNVALSRDGGRLAYISTALDEIVFVLDIASGQTQTFRLYTPGSNGEPIYTVDYADVLEWDYSGENLFYDALNTLTGTDGLSYTNWDIGQINVYRNRDGFADGQVRKLFGTLAEDQSVGNPSLAKNSEQIIAFDLLEGSEYFTLATNVITGEFGNIWQGDRLGWPSYTADDQRVVFNATAQSGGEVIAIADVDASKLNRQGDARLLQSNAYRATAFANGQRVISAVSDLKSGAPWTIVPNPTAGRVRILRMVDVESSDSPFYVYDAAGRQVASFASQSLELDLSSLPAGEYIVQQGSRSMKVLRR